jgi:CsoR family transcriptional regulator, copper-sensing transcriptional repressor
MQTKIRQEALKRLNYIDGHLKGIRTMIEEDQYCPAIVKQTFAVRCAIERAESLMLAGHLRDCVVQVIRDGREEQVIGELLELYELAGRQDGREVTRHVARG